MIHWFFTCRLKLYHKVVEKLTANNIDKKKLLAIIEQATTLFQKVHISSLYEFENKFSEQSFISPSLIIIGKVVALHEKFAWLQIVVAMNIILSP